MKQLIRFLKLFMQKFSNISQFLNTSILLMKSFMMKKKWENYQAGKGNIAKSNEWNHETDEEV